MDSEVVLNRIFEKFNHFEEKLDKTCNTVGDIKTDLALLKQSVTAHLKEREIKEQKNEKKFYIIIAIMGVAFTLYEITKDFI